jgi:hypothetical protein
VEAEGVKELLSSNSFIYTHIQKKVIVLSILPIKVLVVVGKQ